MLGGNSPEVSLSRIIDDSMVVSNVFGDRVGGLASVAWVEVPVVSSLVSFATVGDIFAEVAAIGIFAIVESSRFQVFLCAMNVCISVARSRGGGRCFVVGFCDVLEYAG